VLLAGPILRRRERGRVCILLATSEEVAVNARVLRQPGERDVLGSSDPGLGGSERSVRLGDRLVVHLLEVRPPSDDAATTSAWSGWRTDNQLPTNCSAQPQIPDA
jgi:hypothetical protein